MVAGPTVRAVAVGILELCCHSKAVAVVVELSITVRVTPSVLVNQTVPVVVVADVVVGKSDDFNLQHGDLYGHPFACVVVADNHHVVSVSVVSSVAHELVVVAPLHILGDLEPRRRMAVVPTFVGVGGHFLTPCVGATVHAFVVGEDVRVVLGKPHHSVLHRLIGVVLFELKNTLAGGSPWENIVDVIFRPNFLGRGGCCGFLGIGIFSDRRCEREEQWEDDEEAE